MNKISRSEAYLDVGFTKNIAVFALTGKYQSAILPIGRTDRRVTFLCLGKEK